MTYTFDPDLIICRKCNNTVVWSDYATDCVSCKSPYWSYQPEELQRARINRAFPPRALSTIVCKNCGKEDTISDSSTCSHCNTPKWGYNDFELRYELFLTPKVLPKLVETKKEPANSTPPSASPSVSASISTKPTLPYLSYIIGFGLGIGLLINFLLAHFSYVNYRNSILESKTFTTTFINDPVLNRRFFNADREMHPINSTDFNWRLLVNMGVLDWKSDEKDISPKLNRALDRLKDRAVNLEGQTSLEVLCLVLEGLGREGNIGLNNANFMRRKEILATCLSGGPDSRKLIGEFGSPNPTTGNWLSNFKFFLPVNCWSEKIKIQEVLSTLIADTHADQPFRDLLGAKDPNSPLDLKDEYAQIDDFLMRFVIGIHDDPNVKATRNTFMIGVGIEQYFMYLIFGIGLMILIKNKRNSTYDANRKFSVVIYKWIYIALPSLGFIGTKRGLSKALSGADSIVRANTEVNQSLAISDVSDTMGIAFTSTLVGLVLLMILMLGEVIKRYKYIDWDE